MSAFELALPGTCSKITWYSRGGEGISDSLFYQLEANYLLLTFDPYKIQSEALNNQTGSQGKKN